MIDFNNSKPQKPEKPDPLPDSTPTDPIEAFLSETTDQGFTIGPVAMDGEIHRFDIDKKGDEAGWYIFFQGDLCGAAFGNWKTDERWKWCSKTESTLTYEQREEYREQQKKAKEAWKKIERENHLKVRKIAQKKWDEAVEVEGDNHPYLKNKGVNSHYLRAGTDGILLVPMLDDKWDIWNVERVRPEPGKKKKGLFKGLRKGLFFEIGGVKNNNNIFICEGYSTGASIHAATGATVFCSFDSGNLLRVARTIKKKYPNNPITIAADDDKYNAINGGITKAMEAGRMVNAPVVWPTFQNEDNKPTDFNDLFTMEGQTMCMTQLSGVSKERKKPPLPSNITALSSWLKKRPKNREYLLTINGQPFLPKDVVGALAATGGTGKTFFIMSLSVAMASGGSFGPIKAPRPIKTLCIFGEDDQDELGRRYWDICKGKFPDNLHVTSVYGEVGPLMKMDGKNPIEAEGFVWLEETIKRHKGVEVVFLDPKSRFYGLEENNNDHGTQWIGVLESLRLRYGVTIIFATHTSDANAGKISQTMNRGASSIIDGCRWQAGMVVMDQNTADRYNIEDKQNYVVFDAPKSNYTARQSHPIYFKRGDTGALEYVVLENNKAKSMAGLLFELLDDDPVKYSIRDLKKEKVGADICQDMKENFSSFSRRNDMPDIVKYMIQNDMAKEVNITTGKTTKLVLEVIKK